MYTEFNAKFSQCTPLLMITINSFRNTKFPFKASALNLMLNAVNIDVGFVFVFFDKFTLLEQHVVD